MLWRHERYRDWSGWRDWRTLFGTLIIGSRQRWSVQNEDVEIRIDDLIIKKVEHTKSLGVTIDAQLTWRKLVVEIYIEDITRWREDMNFMFEWHEQYLTSERSERVRYYYWVKAEMICPKWRRWNKNWRSNHQEGWTYEILRCYHRCSTHLAQTRCRNIHRGYYTVARRYEFYVRVAP